jgi:hypothetical protein
MRWLTKVKLAGKVNSGRDFYGNLVIHFAQVTVVQRKPFATEPQRHREIQKTTDL